MLAKRDITIINRQNKSITQNNSNVHNSRFLKGHILWSLIEEPVLIQVGLVSIFGREKKKQLYFISQIWLYFLQRATAPGPPHFSKDVWLLFIPNSALAMVTVRLGGGAVWWPEPDAHTRAPHIKMALYPILPGWDVK